MKHKLVYCAFLESASNTHSVGINKTEIATEYQIIILFYMKDFVKHDWFSINVSSTPWNFLYIYFPFA